MFYNTVHGIIESVDKIKDKKGLVLWKNRSQCTFSIFDVLSSDHGDKISKKSYGKCL